MKERPILFSTPMVRAILAGKKTQTRRVVKIGQGGCPFGTLKDQLWVRETWAFADDKWEKQHLVYRATDTHAEPEKWRPSIFMPRKYSRIILEITNIKIQRIQDVSEEDAKAEGVEKQRIYDPANPDTIVYSFRWPFAYLWDSINAKRGYGWDINPRVWVIEFKRIKNEDKRRMTCK